MSILTYLGAGRSVTAEAAANCRTGVKMIEKHCAAHLKTLLDTAAINIIKPHPKKGRFRREIPAEWGPSAWMTKRRSSLLAL
jgi:hypothetical protein